MELKDIVGKTVAEVELTSKKEECDNIVKSEYEEIKLKFTDRTGITISSVTADDVLPRLSELLVDLNNQCSNIQP